MKQLSVTNLMGEHDRRDELDNPRWQRTLERLFITDATGVRWQICASQHGLEIRALGTAGEQNDSIRVQPVQSNVIRVRATNDDLP